MGAFEGLPELLYLRVPLRWEDIDQVRSLVLKLAGHGCSEGAAERIALVVHELVEAALRYGAFTGDVEIIVAGNEAHYDVHVRHEAVSDRIELLRLALERVKRTRVSECYGLELVRAREGGGDSGIGFARLRTDAAAELTMEVVREHVTIRARG